MMLTVGLGQFFKFSFFSFFEREVPMLCLENSYCSVNDMLYKSMFENNDVENVFKLKMKTDLILVVCHGWETRRLACCRIA